MKIVSVKSAILHILLLWDWQGLSCGVLYLHIYNYAYRRLCVLYWL